MNQWQPIETAPKDGSAILAFGMPTACFLPNAPEWPGVSVIRWHVQWYDKEIDSGDGTYRKQKAIRYAEWRHGGGDPMWTRIRWSHWMPIPDLPREVASANK